MLCWAASVRVFVADRALSGLGGGLGLERHAEICAEAGDRQLAISGACAARPAVCLVAGSISGGAVAAAREPTRRWVHA